MTDQQPAPLQPPAAAAAAHPHRARRRRSRVAATAAPRMAPAVEAAALPGLDAKVDGYLELADGRRAALARSSRPRPTDVRTHGRRRHPRAPPRPRNRLLQTPVKALQGGRPRRGLARSARPCSSCAAPSRTSTRSEATGAKKFLGMIPFGDKVTDYFRKYQSRAEPPRRHPARAARRPGRAAPRTTPRSTWRSSTSGTRWAGSTSTSTSPSGSTRGSPRDDRRARGHRPRAGQGAARGRAVLRPPEAPGPADPAGRVDPELPGHRHRHQEQHRADQGRRPRVDHHRSPRCAPPSSWPRRWATRSSCSTRSPPSTPRRRT